MLCTNSYLKRGVRNAFDSLAMHALLRYALCMSRYIRSHREWGAYFLTIVTHDRYPLFRDSVARRLLRDAMRTTFAKYPLTIYEMVLLPDHMHILCGVPDEAQDYSVRIQQIKRRFTRAWLARGGHEGPRSESKLRRGNRGVWQRRFYEHTIRNQVEFRDHVVYALMNPVKHKLVQRAADWPWSTIHRHLRDGTLTEDWCGPVDLRGVGDAESEVW